jgi:hypothetical protein
MIYITGDVHGSVSIGRRLYSKNFPQQRNMTKVDFVVISGDFGLIWNGDKEDQYWLKWLHRDKPFTTLSLMAIMRTMICWMLTLLRFGTAERFAG